MKSFSYKVHAVQRAKEKKARPLVEGAATLFDIAGTEFRRTVQMPPRDDQAVLANDVRILAADFDSIARDNLARLAR